MKRNAGIVDKSGHKHDKRVAVKCSDLFGCLDSVYLFHADIKKDHIVFDVVFLHR